MLFLHLHFQHYKLDLYTVRMCILLLNLCWATQSWGLLQPGWWTGSRLVVTLVSILSRNTMEAPEVLAMKPWGWKHCDWGQGMPLDYESAAKVGKQLVGLKGVASSTTQQHPSKYVELHTSTPSGQRDWIQKQGWAERTSSKSMKQHA